MIKRRERSYKVFLLVCDACAIAGGFFLSLLLRFNLLKDYLPQKEPVSLQAHLNIFPYILIIWLLVFQFSGLYSPALRGADEFLSLLKGVIISVLVSLSVAFFHREFEYSRIVLVIFTIGVFILVVNFRVAGRWLWNLLISRSGGLRRLAIIGTNELGQTLATAVTTRPLGYELIGFIDDAPQIPTISPNQTNPPYPLLGVVDQTESLISSRQIDEVWIALPGAPREKLQKLVETCLKTKIPWKMVPDMYEVMLDWVKIENMDGIPLIGMSRSNITGLNAVLKRGIDLLFSSIIIILTGPVMLIAAVLIKLTSPGPVLFKQKRIGYNGKRFVFLKFRTMYEGVNRSTHKEFTKKWIEGSVEAENGSDKPVYKIKDDARITTVGKWLRKLSIDELPQLFSVLAGDMSLIGPRPGLAYEVEHYKEWHKRRMEARPGVTGLWQVSGRNLLSFDEMVKLDIYYIENWSLTLDLKIILKTAWVVLSGRAY
jgi:exopolysaccharide biosynthesis polyprenyl glycosylphosphotransferase